jgi:hypothetical protein
MKKDLGLSVWGAAKIYSISYATLACRVNRTTSRRDNLPNSQKLKLLEEEMIIERILNLDSWSYPPQLRDVEDIANRLLAKRGMLCIRVN